MDKKELKAKWIEALRSGEYNQVRGHLKNYVRGTSEPEVGYCCLGVLQSIRGQEPYIEDEAEVTAPVYEELREKLIGDPTLVDSLTDLNDSGCSFKEIANIIEKEWKV